MSEKAISFGVMPPVNSRLRERIRMSATKNGVSPNRYVVDAILKRLKIDERVAK